MKNYPWGPVLVLMLLPCVMWVFQEVWVADLRWKRLFIEQAMVFGVMAVLVAGLLAWLVWLERRS